MSKYLPLVSILAVAALGFTAPLEAQGRSAVSAVELEAAVSARPAGTRQTVRGVVVTGAAAQAQASVTQDGERVLAGGDEKIVISATLLIIVLLLLILLT